MDKDEWLVDKLDP